MSKLRAEDLDKIVEQTKKSLALKTGGTRAKITVHMGTCGVSAGARKILDEAKKCVTESGAGDIMVTTSGCAGLCSREPMITVELIDQEPVKYVDLTTDKVRKIFDEHVKSGHVVEEYALVMGREQVL